MSTETTLGREAELLRALVKCNSVTPLEGGALGVLEKELSAAGFHVERVTFSDKNTPDVENLYARIGEGNPHLMFAGHTDVVPEGDISKWRSGPFEGTIIDNEMIGRGTVDMKGGIAAFLAACETYLFENGKPNGSISFLITGDEEGPAINGTDKLLKWASEKGERWDASIVGEPSNQQTMGDTIKIGRRGSITAKLTVTGVQGHAAYPHLADNPLRGMTDLLNALLAEPLDAGSENFQATNLEVTSVDTGNVATNVIPERTTALFNIRFNDHWTADSLKAEISKRLDQGAKAGRIRTGKRNAVNYELEWLGRPNHVFLTRDESLIEGLGNAIEAVTGNRPQLSTSGGTSDARFIKDYCAVVEFGLVGQTMHQIDERTSLSDLSTLKEIYLEFLKRYF